MAAFEARTVRPLSEAGASKEGIRIVSFDGGGPSSYSQTLMLKEIIKRMEWDIQNQEGVDSDEEPDFDEDKLCPADYFDMMGGVGFGGYCALMFGRLRLSFELVTDELIRLARIMLPNTPSEIVTPDANSDRLKSAIEDMLQRNGFPADMPLKGKTGQGRQCKVVIFVQATSTPGKCTPFRSYAARSSETPKCTFVEAACAAISRLPDFSPIGIGLVGVKVLYAGIPLGFNNPTRKVLNEAFAVFGKQRQISLILSLGGGKQLSSSLHLGASLDSSIATLLARIVMDSERIDDELTLQLAGVNVYLRLDVDQGPEDTKISDWHELGAIEAHTRSYLGDSSVSTSIDKTLRSIRTGDHITFAQFHGAACQAVSRAPLEQMLNGLEREVKDMRDIVMQNVEKITIIDAIGNRTSIPLEYCATYQMLQDMVKFYFKHQKAPGSSFVNRGDYKLTYGEDRRTVKRGEWTYLQGSNLTLEMSMVVRKRGLYWIGCPKCGVKFDGIAKNGWAICSNQACKMPYQYQAKPYRSLRASDYKKSKDNRTVAKDNASSISQTGTNERIDQFRLISVVQQDEVFVRIRS